MRQEWERKARDLLSRRSGSESPHFAPPEVALAVMRQVLHRHAARRGGTALVLGATPELVVLARQAGLVPLCVDRSRLMLAAARLRLPADTAPPPAVLADWCALPLALASIDVVLGDAALNNVAVAETASVLAEVRRVCRGGALVLLRQIVLPDGALPDHEFPAARAAYRAGRISLAEFDRALRFYAFLALAYDAGTKSLDAARVFAAIDALQSRGELSADEHARLAARRSDVRHTVLTVDEQLHALKALGDCAQHALPESCFIRPLMSVFAVHVR